MHPVEHLFYFSCFALAFVVPYHPCHLLLNKYHTDLSALGGHGASSHDLLRVFAGTIVGKLMLRHNLLMQLVRWLRIACCG